MGRAPEAQDVEPGKGQPVCRAVPDANSRSRQGPGVTGVIRRTECPRVPPGRSNNGPCYLTPMISRTVKGLSLVSLFNDFASEMVYPLLPAFVTLTLGGGAMALGALDGAADLTSAAAQDGEWQAGRPAAHGEGRSSSVGYATAVLVRPLIAVAGAAWQVVGFRVIDRVGKGLRTAPRATRSSPRSRRPLSTGPRVRLPSRRRPLRRGARLARGVVLRPRGARTCEGDRAGARCRAVIAFVRARRGAARRGRRSPALGTTTPAT